MKMRSGLAVADAPESLIDLDAYLRRIGLGSSPAADLRGLEAVHEAHCAAIPFENLDILLGRPISLDLRAVQDKLVTRRRGGYCFEQNTLFAAALEALGFRLTRLSARVRANMTELRPRTHMLLRVDLPEGAFVADVGFGGDGLVLPVPLEGDHEVFAGERGMSGALGHRVVQEGAEARVLQASVDGEWHDLYTFTLEPQYAVDYEMANHFTSTYPRSPFVRSLTAQRARRHRRAILRNRDLVVRDAGGVRASSIRNPDHLLEVLAAEFDLVFPPGTRFSRPEFG